MCFNIYWLQADLICYSIPEWLCFRPTVIKCISERLVSETETEHLNFWLDESRAPLHYQPNRGQNATSRLQLSPCLICFCDRWEWGCSQLPALHQFSSDGTVRLGGVSWDRGRRQLCRQLVRMSSHTLHPVDNGCGEGRCVDWDEAE